MNNNIRNTIWRAIVIVVVSGTAASIIGWIMRARFDASVSPIKELRPSAWTALGVAAMCVPLLVAVIVGAAWVFNRPGAATADNRLARTIGLLAVVGGLVAAAVVIAANDPLKGKNSSIFWRGLGSGVIGGVALLFVEFIVFDLVRRHATQLAGVQNELRRRETLLDAWHGGHAGWEPHLPA